MVRKWRQLEPSIEEQVLSRRARIRCIGSPYVPLDPLAKWMMWGSTLLLMILAVVMRGTDLLALLAIGVPIALAAAVMIARMGGRNWMRVVALVYLILMFFVITALPG
jgi:hypothetical protein